MSTPEFLPEPSRLTPLLADMLLEIEIGTSKPSELSDGADELSARELEILRYLPTMLTTGEIAAELYVSANTIKAHMRSIYRKLDVSRRQAAVVRAYEYGILRPRSSARPSADAEMNSQPGAAATTRDQETER